MYDRDEFVQVGHKHRRAIVLFSGCQQFGLELERIASVESIL